MLGKVESPQRPKVLLVRLRSDTPSMTMDLMFEEDLPQPPPRMSSFYPWSIGRMSSGLTTIFRKLHGH